MNKIELTKTITKFVVGVSTSATVGAVIRNNVNPENTLQKVEIAIGAATVGAIAAEHAKRFTDQMIDEVVAAFRSTN